jgi:NADH dehydrogenase/NADH:ubiquinone oxidoreductase subunit G
MNITIDGKTCACEKGEYLLDIAARNGITIPSLCHHEGLPGQGCCRVCIVEVELNGRRSVVTACVYPIERECAVFTGSEPILRQRGMVLALLRSLAPESAEVARLCEEHAAPIIPRFVARPGKKCVLCGLCAKACESLGTGAISTVNRGVDKDVSTPYGEMSAVCVGCKSCAAVCPTGAIEVSEDENNRTIWNKTFPIRKCARCKKPLGTMAELRRAAQITGAEIPAHCETCRKKNITDVLAATYAK